MKQINDEDEIIFKITKGWIQQESIELIGRELTECELHSVKKGIEWGLLTDIDTVFKTAILNAPKYFKPTRFEIYKKRKK